MGDEGKGRQSMRIARSSTRTCGEMRGGNEIGRILERGGVERWRLGEERVESSVIEPDGRRGNGEEEGKESREGERRRRGMRR